MEKTYTESAITDRIREYILSRKDITKVVEHIGATCRGKFLFNPLEAPQEIQDIFLDEPEDFKFLVKKTICRLVAEWQDDDHSISVMNNVPVILTGTTKIKIKDWNSDYEGVVMSAVAQIIGAYKEETYNISGECYCSGCDTTLEFQNHPLKCQNDDCKRKFQTMEINMKNVKTGMQRTVLVQEPVEESEFGNLRTMEVILRDEAVYDTHIGQRKKITGVFRSQPQKGKTTNRFYIHALSVEDAEDVALVYPSKEQLKEFEETAKNQSTYLKLLTKSFAPHIYGEDLPKLCLMLSRVSGGAIEDHEKDILDSLLVGNPGTSKSELLKFLVSVTQKSAYANGGTSSGSSITATMMTMPNREKIVQAGIVSQCTDSLVALDEVSQFEEEDLGKLLEAMSLRTIHYNKGGIKVNLIAETAICGATNPKRYLYNPAVGMTKNIGLPAPLIDRFGLIVNMQPKRLRSEEEAKTTHIEKIDKMKLDKFIEAEKLLTKDQMRMILNHCKTLKPVITDKANAIIRDFYFTMFDLQSNNEQEDDARPINTRFQIALRRIAKAYARLMLCAEVTEEHAMVAKDIMVKCLQSFGVKTDKGQMQLNLSDVITDAETAAEFTWKTMEKETNSKLIDIIAFYKRLINDHPTYYNNTDDVDVWFKKQEKKDRFVQKGGYYQLVD